ncbi:DUF6765 family protein [Candidatus Lariskella endosymbiont of Epinotia ramella]|uniref:DUF6765 family protein n=1 Tax=Candidatus Lariskella endosymbiont of Epinotia ramella TaxID=3066224 RepID=UPI0030D1DF8D
MTTLYTTTTQHINQKMDIEFHYYVTYLVYIKAGFNKNEAEIIAYASQYVDDNTAQAYVKSRGSGAIVYRSMITQTYDITLPKSIMHQIYIAFHFIPGFSSQSHSTDMHRKDGKKHHMMTVAGSVPSRILMYSALQSGDLYWIGIATHAFLDTWAHQNFTGTMDDFNGFSDIKSIVIPNIGHADAMSAPDELCRKWCDPRLKNPKIDNNKRFLEAAFSLFSILFEVKKPNISKQNLILEWEIIEQDLITIDLLHNLFKAQSYRYQQVN